MQIGPVAITVSANWATYGGGIFSDGCIPMNMTGYSCTLDHAVVAVGYTADYWLVRVGCLTCYLYCDIFAILLNTFDCFPSPSQ